MKTRICMTLLALILASPAAAAWNDEDPSGVFTISPVYERSCVAVRVPCKSTQALMGFRWWNNDAATDFPRVMVASGLNDVPPIYDDGLTVGENVGGAEAGWSEWYLPEPLASDTGTLYVVFQLPANTEGTAWGEGPGFGYIGTETGSCVWLSSDGDDWLRLVTDYQLLVDPVYTSRDDGTLALKCSRPDEEPGDEPAAVEVPDIEVTRTELLVPYPNPFNPETKLAFTLLNPSHVTITLYDIKGRLVKKLIDEHHGAGLHDVVWRGEDDSGRRAASGVYFARMRADGRDEIQRMMLVK